MPIINPELILCLLMFNKKKISCYCCNGTEKFIEADRNANMPGVE